MNILAIEDDLEMASFVQRILSEEGHSVETVHDGESGLALARSKEFDLLIVDRMLPRKDGLELAHVVVVAMDAVDVVVEDEKWC